MVRDRRGISAIGRLGVGGAIALVAALLLLYLMFQQWYGMAVTVNNDILVLGYFWAGMGDGWQVLGTATALLAALAIAASIGMASIRLVGAGRKVTVAAGAVVAALGLVASLLIFIRIVFPSDPAGPGAAAIATNRELDTAIFLALFAALAVVIGGLASMVEAGVRLHLEAGRTASAGRPSLRQSST